MSEDTANKCSIVKIEANRKNAQKSTGPRTQEGKAISRWNALKHGLLASEVVISAGEGKESQADFTNLLLSLRRDLQPQGVLEEILVEKIAVCYWRLRRVHRFEMGAIRGRLDTARRKRIEAKVDMLPTMVSFSSVLESGAEKLNASLRRSSQGIGYQLELLDEVREEVQESGRVSEATQRRLVDTFGSKSGSIANHCVNVSDDIVLLSKKSETPGTPISAEQDLEPRFVRDPNEGKALILKELLRERRDLERLKKIVEGHENEEMELHLATLNLPSRKAMDKILRYETTIERQLYRAMDQLERLQRQRSGEVVPPPLKIQVASEK